MARTKRKNGLLPKQKVFVKHLSEGKNISESATLTGYSNAYASRLVKKGVLIKALDDAGLGDKELAVDLQKAIKSGLGKKAKNSDAIKGLKLAYELKGGLNKQTPDKVSQTNIYIKELKALDDTALLAKVGQLTDSIKELGTPDIV